jgi:hypothetical protein
MWFVPRDGLAGRSWDSAIGRTLACRLWLGCDLSSRSPQLTRAAFEFLAPGLPAYPTFLVAVLFAALQQGAAAGLFAMVLGAIGGAYFLMSPLLTPAIGGRQRTLFRHVLLVIWGAEHFRRGSSDPSLEEQADATGTRHLIVNQNEILRGSRPDAPLSEVFRQARPHIEEFSEHTMLGSILLLDRDGIHLRLARRPACRRTTTTPSTAARSDRRPVHAARRRIARRPSSSPTSSMTRLGRLSRFSPCPTNLRACWSTPSCRVRRVCSAHSPSTYREPRSPSPDDLELSPM